MTGGPPETTARPRRIDLTRGALLDLVARNIGVRAGRLDLLTGIDLRLRSGELCGLIGPSGAGKSTLIRVLLGLSSPWRGEVTLGGRPVAGPVGYVPQDDALHTSLRVVDALNYAAELRLYGMPEVSRTARVREVIRLVALEERVDVRIGKLSGGQRKRVSVAMELLSQPALLILDEPTSGLDPGMELKMMETFAGVARAGRVVIVSTHAMQSLDRCDALVVLAKGLLVYFGPPSEAPGFFGARDLVDLFVRLAGAPPADWAARFAASGIGPAFVGRGSMARVARSLEAVPPPGAPGPSMPPAAQTAEGAPRGAPSDAAPPPAAPGLGLPGARSAEAAPATGPRLPRGVDPALVAELERLKAERSR